MAYVFNEAVFKAEANRIENRRQALEQTPRRPAAPQETIGLALSGGGIRSATLSLGVIQSLAKRDLLQKIDYLSTVSGGGYAGCFLGSFFLPENLRQGLEAGDEEFRNRCRDAFAELKAASTPAPQPPGCGGVRSMLTRRADEDEPPGARGWSAAKAFDWLRNNGRYLAPRGAGDLVYVVAMQIRNWAAVQYVVGVMIMFLLVIFSTLRAWLIATSPRWRQVEVLFLPEPGAAVYWSPGWVFVAAFSLVLLPPALAYWLAHSRVDHKRILSWLPLWHQVAIIVLLLVGLSWAYSVMVVLPSNGILGVPLEDLPRAFWAAAAYIVLALSAIVTFLVGLGIERRAALTGMPDLKSLRTRFTRWLGSAFWLTLGGAGLALLGTIGQTAYAYMHFQRPGAAGIAGVTSVVAALVAGARQLFKWLGSGGQEAHPRIPLGALAGAAAVVLALITGGAWATLVQAALWKAGPPPAIPAAACEVGACGAKALRIWHHASAVDVSRWKLDPDSPRPAALDPHGTPRINDRPVAIAPGWMSVLLAGIAFLFFTTGMFLNFINMSSLHQFYAARLGRAYLGATNRQRFKDGGVEPVTTPLPTDTIRLEAYYHPKLAGPVHLINVTVNQTRPSQEQLVQRDRKGVGMVVGPGYTVVNAAIFEREDCTGNLWPINGEAANLAGQDKRPWRRFDSEELDLADWCAISGAAFSTGLGMRTSLGYSLLAGLANVRLGYWWNFNTERQRALQLAAYRYLWSELMADFKGPWKPFWFLTDGGHFENSAAYELVRRRVGTIILCDNGCDPEYEFDDLGNLARKIRTDFGAELLPATPPDNLVDFFGTPEQFARKKARNGRCALLYWIRYPADPKAPVPPPPDSLLVVLKPNLLPKVDIDVEQYAKANQPFPHQSTLDQFFDDAQWESYRKLGEMMADAVLEPGALDLGGWRATVPPVDRV